MQTFLPSPRFSRSAAVLDLRRLGKQIVEARQIALAITPGSTSGWQNHPAVRMWRGYPKALFEYAEALQQEWQLRRQTTHLAFTNMQEDYHDRGLLLSDGGIDFAKSPVWLGDERLHASHRSNLLRKDSEYYGIYGWAEPDNLPYWWPV